MKNTNWDGRSPDFLREEKRLHLAHPIRQMMADKVADDCSSVLDVGCASCISYPYFKNAKIQYTGVDFTENFINRAKEFYPEVTAIKMDATKLDFLDNSFDAVCCKAVIEHIQPYDLRMVLGEMCRVACKLVLIAFFLAPLDGPTVYRWHHKGFWSNQYSKIDLSEILEELGWYLFEEIVGVTGNFDLWVMRKMTGLETSVS
jgi:ubiquinone/menaquinone biosynthesis C-methylase UbiE